MRATCKDTINAINRNDDNCPIILEKMTFNLFYHYMSIEKGKNPGVYISVNRYGGIRSALTHLYQVSEEDMDQGFKKELSQMVIMRVISYNKRKYGINLEEGKNTMSFDV